MSAETGASFSSTLVVVSLQSGCDAVSVHVPGASPAISYLPSASVAASFSDWPPPIRIMGPGPPPDSWARTVASRTGRPVRDSTTRPAMTPPFDSRTSTPSAVPPSSTVTAAALPFW
jgi:hypothetical protein